MDEDTPQPLPEPAPPPAPPQAGPDDPYGLIGLHAIQMFSDGPYEGRIVSYHKRFGYRIVFYDGDEQEVAKTLARKAVQLWQAEHS